MPQVGHSCRPRSASSEEGAAPAALSTAFRESQIAPMTHEGPRRLVAVWFAEIVDYAGLSAQDEVLAQGVGRELQRVARLQCDALGGRVAGRGLPRSWSGPSKDCAPRSC